jgi:heat shock protein HslJ
MHDSTLRDLAAACIGLAFACVGTLSVSHAGAGEKDVARDSSAPNMQELGDATYGGIDGLGRIPLVEGRWQGEPFVEGGAASPRVWLSPGFYLAGDLDDDGAEEAVIHLVYSSGGTGDFGYLAVMARENGGIVQRALGLMGDRVQIREARMVDGSVEIDVLQASSKDGMCCPSQLATRIFNLQEGRFEETASIVTGSLSLATLEGVTWTLREAVTNEDRPPITLQFDSGRLSGSAGCNRFNGSITSSETATGIAIGPLMTTRMACPGDLMERERDFLAQLQQARVFRFTTGDLVLAGSGASLAFMPGHD